MPVEVAITLFAFLFTYDMLAPSLSRPRLAYHERAGVAMPERQAALYIEQVLSAAAYCHQ